MENENKDTPTTPETKTEDKSDNKPLTIVEEARAIRDEINKLKEELKEENTRKEKIQANDLLGSSAGGRVEPEVKGEETPKEYSERVLSGQL